MNKRLSITFGFSLWLIGVCLAIFIFFSAKSQSEDAPVALPSPSPSVTRPMPIEVDPNIPKEIYPCMVPKADQISLINKGEEVKKIKLLSQATDRQNQTYYYLNIETVVEDGEPIPNSFQPLIKLAPSGECTSLHSEDELAPFSYYVDMSVARKLALESTKVAIERAGGKESYQQALIEDSMHDEEKLFLSVEDIWVYKQLGISIPKRYQPFYSPISRSGDTNQIPEH